MKSTLKTRVERLENSRHRVIGELNAQRTLLISAWATLVRRSSRSPDEVLRELRSTLLPEEPKQTRTFVALDPAEFAAVDQDFRQSLEDLILLVERTVAAK